MKTLLIIGLCFIATALIADSSKHQFTFTIIVNEMTLEEAGEFEDELQELLEGYGEKASLEIQMGIIPKESENLWYYQYPLEGKWNYLLKPYGLDSIFKFHNNQFPLKNQFMTIDNEPYGSDLLNKLKVK